MICVKINVNLYGCSLRIALRIAPIHENHPSIINRRRLQEGIGQDDDFRQLFADHSTSLAYDEDWSILGCPLLAAFHSSLLSNYPSTIYCASIFWFGFLWHSSGDFFLFSTFYLTTKLHRFIQVMVFGIL